MKFGQLILSKIVKTIAIRFQILRLKCNKINFGCGSALDLLGELQRSPAGRVGVHGGKEE